MVIYVPCILRQSLSLFTSQCTVVYRASKTVWETMIFIVDHSYNIQSDLHYLQQLQMKTKIAFIHHETAGLHQLKL